MNYLLLQNSPCINDLTIQLLRKYPSSSVVKTSGVFSPKSPPLLTDRWIVVVYLSNRTCLKQIMQSKNTKNIAHFIFVSSDNSGAIQKALNENEFEYNLVNNMNVLEKDLIKYVCDVLGVTNYLGKRIVSKSRLYEPLVIKNVELLSIVKEKQLTSSEVDKYLFGSSCVSFNYLYRYILLGEGDYKKVIELINKYQNNIYVLCNFIIDKLESDIDLFNKLMDGILTKNNYTTYSSKENISIYSLQQTIVLFQKVTLETLYTKLFLFRSLKNSNCVEFIMKGCKLWTKN